MKKKFIIIGGVAGGASAAARLRRLDESASITIFERGEYVSFANCGLPYHIGDVIKDRNRLLVTNPDALKSRFNIDVFTCTEVTKIIPHRKAVEVKDLATGEEKVFEYDSLVLSPGAAPKTIPLKVKKGIFSLRNMSDMDKINAFIAANKPKSAVICGGGFIGLEMVENLWKLGISVNLVQRSNQVMSHFDYEMSAIIHRELHQKGVNLFLSNSLNTVNESESGLEVVLKSGKSITCDIVVMGLGVTPETKLAKDAGLKIGDNGGILVNKYLQSSDPFIYAVGDAIEVENIVTEKNTLLPLAGPANKQGRLAASNICGEKKEFAGVQGTEIIRVFDLTVAKTGIAEKAITDSEVEFFTTVIHPINHAGYYPGATQMSIKLIFSKNRGSILGAQIVGMDGVDKRIDVLATAIRAKMSVKDLTELELAYSPQYSLAKDPVNMVGFVAENILSGKVNVASYSDVEELSKTHEIIDVRTKSEFVGGSIKGAKNFPVDELRKHLMEIPNKKPLLVYCAAGLRGYVACRILMQNGFKSVVNLSGGYLTYRIAMEKLPEKSPFNASRGVEKMAEETEGRESKKLDACGMACPGPIVEVFGKLQSMSQGGVLEVSATDPGFVNDIKAWCEKTGNKLLNLATNNGVSVANIQKGMEKHGEVAVKENANEATMVVFSCDLDRVIASFIIATGAASIGKQVTLFFTFWGLNVLRKSEYVNVKKTLIEKMFGLMMPKGNGALKLSKMNMGGMGTSMMKSVMKSKNVPSLEELIKTARDMNVRLVACQMTMDIMGIKAEELIDGVELGGVGSYVSSADNSGINLFI